MKQGVICYYSGTGNTKLACQYIKKHLSDAKTELFDIKKEKIPDLDLCDFIGFATFTDWGDPPLYLKSFIDKLPRQKNKPAFLFNTCAGMSGKTLKTLKGWVEDKGFKVISGFSLKAPENYPPAVAKGRLMEHYPPANNLNGFKAFIRNLDILLDEEKGQNSRKFKIKIGLLNAVMPKFPRDKSKKMIGNKYVDNSLCTKCKTCMTVCPPKAIDLDEWPIFDENKCHGCWSCYNHCPQKAIYTDTLQNKGHYGGPPELYRNKLNIE